MASRWGVMFFADPVAAFTNLHAATRAGGALRVITWRGPHENPFMTTAERAAAPLLDLPTRSGGEPGQFGLADPAHIHEVLGESGWRNVELAPIDRTCSFPAAALDAYLTNLGPFGRAIRGEDEATRARVLNLVRPAFDPYLEADDVRFDAACWLVSAQA
ncbi:MAG: hypothetical protein S0880_24310 [Actinomycetota bacterium]|nr:hypothetical protein [Actinomycetota bacterium]